MDECKQKLKDLYEAPDIFDITPVTVASGSYGDSDVIFDPEENDGDF